MHVKESEILMLIKDDRRFDQGFNALVIRYQEPLYWTIRRMVHVHEDADDVLQNTFIKVFRNIKGFKGDSSLYTWLYRIACNEALNFLRKRKSRPVTDKETSVGEAMLEADSYFDGDAAQLCLVNAIDTLPGRQKQVFVLRYYDELSYADMSEILETSVGALKASFHHAMKKVEDYLKENLDYVQR